MRAAFFRFLSHVISRPDMMGFFGVCFCFPEACKAVHISTWGKTDEEEYAGGRIKETSQVH
jgi:hypothetical protein